MECDKTQYAASISIDIQFCANALKGEFHSLKVLYKPDTDRVLFTGRRSDSSDEECLYVIKMVDSKYEIEAEIHNELQSLPFVLKLHKTIKSRKHFFLISKYHQYGDLFSITEAKGALNEAEMRNVAAELVVTLEAIHEKNIIHMDIKLPNVLLDDEGNVLLTDFGLSCRRDIAKTCLANDYVPVSTAGNEPPELVKGEHVDTCTDWWQLGLLCYEVMTLKHPFNNEVKNGIPVEIAILNIEPEMPEKATQSCSDFLRGLLSKDFRTRLGTNGAQEVKNHPFLKDIDWTALLHNKEYRSVSEHCDAPNMLTDASAQASALTSDTAEVSQASAQASALTSDTAEVSQASAQSSDTAEVAQAAALPSDTAEVSQASAQASALTSDTTEVAQASVLTSDTAEVAQASAQASALTSDTAEVAQASALTSDTAEVAQPSALTTDTAEMSALADEFEAKLII